MRQTTYQNLRPRDSLFNRLKNRLLLILIIYLQEEAGDEITGLRHGGMATQLTVKNA